MEKPHTTEPKPKAWWFSLAAIVVWHIGITPFSIKPFVAGALLVCGLKFILSETEEFYDNNDSGKSLDVMFFGWLLFFGAICYSLLTWNGTSVS